MPKKKSQAREIWDHIVGLGGPFTSNEVAEETKVAVETVRHYLSFWSQRGSVEPTGTEEEIGKRGRPCSLWRVVSDKFISVWRY